MKRKKRPVSLPSLRKQESHHPHVMFIDALCVTLHRVCSGLIWWEKIPTKQQALTPRGFTAQHKPPFKEHLVTSMHRAKQALHI